MREETQALLKKFEQDHEINVGLTETQLSWSVFAQMQEKTETGYHTRHIGKRYVSGPNENGKVRIFSDIRNSDEYVEESWGTMELCDDFVEKALAHILTDKIAIDREGTDVCTTRCA